MDLRAQHREALQAADDLIRRVTDDDLTRPTPCAAWTLADLLAHMVGQHVGFAAAARDGDAPRSAYAPVPFTPAAGKPRSRTCWTCSRPPTSTRTPWRSSWRHAVADRQARGRTVPRHRRPHLGRRALARRAVPPPHEVAELVARIADGIPDDERRIRTGRGVRAGANRRRQHVGARAGPPRP